MNSFMTIPKFKFWCQKILPLVYDDSLSYVETLYKVVDYLNKVIEDINNIPDYINEVVSEDKLKDILSELLDELREQIARANEGDNTTASFDRDVNELVWLDGKLIRMTRAILAGDRYVEDDGTPDVTGNFVYTSVEIELQRVKNSLNTEITNRELADTQLQANINAEASTRQQADTQLQSNIDAETLARQQADTQLQNNIDNEVTARSNADTQLQNNIDSEASTRLAVDNAIGERITNEIATREPNLHNREFLVIGDSYGDEDGEWATLVPNMLNIETNKWHKVCVGGAGFISNGTLTFLAQAQNYTGDKNAITDIIICGGLNDSVSSTISDAWWSNLASAMDAFDTYVKENYPNAQISLGYIGNGVDYESGSLISGRVYACRQLCKYFYKENACNLGWKLLHNVEFALCTNYANMGSDGVHPSTLGSYALAQAIAQAIISGQAEIRYPLYDVTNGDSKIQYSIVNDITTLHIRNYYIPVASGSTIQSASEWQTLNNLYFNHVTELLCVARLDNFNNKPFQYVSARLQFQGNKLRVELTSTDENGNFISSYTATSQAYLRLFDCDINIKTEYLA